ncbi:MAG: SHD1 domain-containing protein, partial [Rubripirellula sp.]
MRILAAVLILLATFNLPLFAREWVDSSGTYRIEAELVAIREDRVILKKPDGSVVAIPRSRLSGPDQAFLESLPKAGTN